MEVNLGDPATLDHNDVAFWIRFRATVVEGKDGILLLIPLDFIFVHLWYYYFEK